MEGGVIVVKGDVYLAGEFMKGGKMVVEGNVWTSPARKSNSGEIIIKGDVGGYAGVEMNGGSLLIEGNAGDYAGKWMHGGMIIINQDAGKCVGFDSDYAACIYLNRDFESIADNVGATIYWDNRLVDSPVYAAEMAGIEKYIGELLGD
ncbi:MAG: hypothetical protein U9P44_00375, partial [archaeon]|nr:hypothetical protein [archaeon]